MKIGDVQVMKEPLVLATQAQIDALESKLWMAFPTGYREYLTQFGEGFLGSFVRIYPPWRIESELAEWRRRISKYWFWDEGPEVLPRERALECMIIGDTLSGDELVFHPGRPGHLFVLPRHHEQIFDAGPDLLAAVQWIFDSGQLIEPPPELQFEPFDSREQQDIEAHGPAGKVNDPEGESLEDLVELGKQWAERHSARKLAQQDLKKQVGDLKRQFGADRTSTLLYETIILDGEPPYEPGYLAVFRIADKSSRLEVGTFAWQKSESSYGASYEPNQANVARLAKPK